MLGDYAPKAVLPDAMRNCVRRRAREGGGAVPLTGPLGASQIASSDENKSHRLVAAETRRRCGDFGTSCDRVVLALFATFSGPSDMPWTELFSCRTAVFGVCINRTVVNQSTKLRAISGRIASSDDLQDVLPQQQRKSSSGASIESASAERTDSRPLLLIPAIEHTRPLGSWPVGYWSRLVRHSRERCSE